MGRLGDGLAGCCIPRCVGQTRAGPALPPGLMWHPWLHRGAHGAAAAGVTCVTKDRQPPGLRGALYAACKAQLPAVLITAACAGVCLHPALISGSKAALGRAIGCGWASSEEGWARVLPAGRQAQLWGAGGECVVAALEAGAGLAGVIRRVHQHHDAAAGPRSCAVHGVARAAVRAAAACHGGAEVLHHNGGAAEVGPGRSGRLCVQAVCVGGALGAAQRSAAALHVCAQGPTLLLQQSCRPPSSRAPRMWGS